MRRAPLEIAAGCRNSRGRGCDPDFTLGTSESTLGTPDVIAILLRQQAGACASVLVSCKPVCWSCGWLWPRRRVTAGSAGCGDVYVRTSRRRGGP
eukprot:270155-Prorocentrum_minimum.AAC.1